MGGSPCFFFFYAGGYDTFQFFGTFGIKFLHVVENHERIFRVCTEVHHGILIGVSTERGTVRLAVMFVRGIVVLAGTFTHDTLTDNQRRTLFFCFGCIQRFANLFAVVTVDFNDVPVPCTVFHGRVFGRYILGFGRKLDVVGVVEHDQVVQTEAACNTACALGDFFLNASVGNICVDSLFGKSRITGTCGQELGSDGGTYGKHVSLSQRTGSVFDATHYVYFGMARGGGAPLAQLFQFIQCELTDKRQLGIEHGSHVAGVEEETVSSFPFRISRVVLQKFRVQYIDEIGTTHCTARVTGFGFFNHGRSQDTDVVGCVVHYLFTIHIH